MASPPPGGGGGGPVLEEKAKVVSSSIHEASLDPNVASGNTTLDTKAATLKIADEMAEPQVNQAAVQANGDVPAVVNGHTGSNGMSNGVKTSADEQNQPEKEQPTPTPADVSQTPQSYQEEEAAPASVPAPPPSSSVEPPAPAEAPGAIQADPEPEPEPEPVAKLEPSPTTGDDAEQAATAATTAQDDVQPETAGPSTTTVEETEQPPPSPMEEDEDVAAAPAAEGAVEPQPSPAAPTTAAADQPASSKADEVASTPVTPAVAEKPAAEEEQPASEPPPVDQEMADAPPMSPTKVPRERDEEVDASGEPAAKRTKTEEASQDDSQFKVPELPASATAPPPSTTTTTPQNTSAPITKMQSKFLTRILQSLKRSHDARFYRDPVDPVKLNIPSYHQVIQTPMDLRKIEEKLKGGQYQTVDEVIADFHLMIQNSAAFNGPEHVVTTEGKGLVAAFERHLSKLPSPDEVELTAAEKKAKRASFPGIKSQPPRESRTAAASRKSSTAAAAPTAGASPTAGANANADANNAGSPTTFALGPEGLPLIRRDSSAVDGRPKRSIHPPKNRDFPYSAKPKKKKFQWELKFCQEVLDELHKPKYYNFASPFYQPVDPVALNIPTYHNVIKKPMDLQTIQAKLQAGSYENAKEFEGDMKLIFKNCYKFNPPADLTHLSGKKLEELFQQKWSQKNRWLDAHKPTSGPQSAGTSDNESALEEESDEDAEADKLSQLQKQIAEMSKQVEAITQKKKKTPPTAAKKGGKQKGGKKETNKKAPPAKKEKKSSAPKAKREKQRWVTYHEKKLISTAFATLPQKKSDEALAIIQNNVPSLKGTDEAEVELDMDDLPNGVLLKLLDFVKKHSPSALEFDEPAPEPVAATVAPPKPRKNKPMSKHEQEANINILEGKLKNFEGRVGQAPAQAAAVESSDDDEVSEESEEE